MGAGHSLSGHPRFDVELFGELQYHDNTSL